MSDDPNKKTETTEETTSNWMLWTGIILLVIGIILIVLKFVMGSTLCLGIGILGVIFGGVFLLIHFLTSPEEETAETDKDPEKKDPEKKDPETFTNGEILVPTDLSSLNGYSTNVGSTTVDGTMQNLGDSLQYRGTVDYVGNYPPNPDLYPENGQEFLPENSMYTHLENNFLDIGPQIGVATRVNSQRNGPTLLFRKQFAVPTMPTGYWNQSTISQPIFTNNVC